MNEKKLQNKSKLISKKRGRVMNKRQKNDDEIQY